MSKASDALTELVEHWGMNRSEVLLHAYRIVEAARDERRPNTSDRHQYDAWTRTLLAVINEAATEGPDD